MGENEKEESEGRVTEECMKMGREGRSQGRARQESRRGEKMRSGSIMMKGTVGKKRELERSYGGVRGNE